MALIELETFIAAPPERCFDLSRSIALHLASASSTRERVVSASTDALMRLGDTVTWEARHLGLRHRLTVRIAHYDRPRAFRDEMINGPFRSMRHVHSFRHGVGGTMMRDTFQFSTIFPPFDSLVLAPHLRRFLIARNSFLGRVAEGDEWRKYMGD